MNIFITSNDPYQCAVNLDDKRCVKMTLETCQILSTVMHMYGQEGPYKPTHVKHPCVLWAAENINNYKWLLRHFRALLDQYEARYDKQHACFAYLKTFYQFAHQRLTKYTPPTYFVNCTPYKDVKNVHLAYQLCLNDKWDTDKREPTWFGIKG